MSNVYCISAISALLLFCVPAIVAGAEDTVAASSADSLTIAFEDISSITSSHPASTNLRGNEPTSKVQDVLVFFREYSYDDGEAEDYIELSLPIPVNVRSRSLKKEKKDKDKDKKGGGGGGSDKGSDGDTPPPALPSSGADTPDTPLQAPSPVPSSVPSSSGEAITKASSPIVIGGSYSGMLSTLGHTVVQPVEGAKKRQLKRTHRKTHGKIGFADLARLISSRWKSLDDETRRPYEEQAKVERARYQEELNKYRERKEREEKEAEAKQDAKKTGMETALISGASTLLSDLPDGSVVQPTNGISSLMMPPVVPMFSPQPPSSLSYVCNGKAYPAT
mmetsp:Transcript_35709/g.72448  ORF Transcript_35709/g.72448 Transcript_35709/m.72448 type:complete len:335 (+) Transcript_35709:3253-4257(+)